MSAPLSGDATMGVGVDCMRIALGVGGGGMGASVGEGMGAAVGEGMGAAVGEGMGVAVGAGGIGAAVGAGATVAIGLISARGSSGSVPQAASANDAATATATAANVDFAPKIPIRMMPFRPSRRF